MKRRIFHQFLIFVGLVAVVGVWAAAPASAAEVTVVANLDGGGSEAEPVTDLVDAYTGMAGDGWASAWLKAISNGTVAGAVLNTTPLSTGGGNYLNTVMEGTGASGGRGAVGRGYGYDATSNPGGIKLDALTAEHPLTISFKYRIEEDLSTFTDSTADYFEVWDYTTVRNGMTSAARWCVYGTAVGGAPGNWIAVNGNYDTTFTPVDTGIVLQSGVVYDFGIMVRPDLEGDLTHMRWDLTIGNGATTWNSTTLYPHGMGWRGSATTPGGYVNFLALANTTGEQRRFSVDSLTVTGPGGAPDEPPPYYSPVVARFTDGENETSVDAYRGTPGINVGWKTAWNAVTTAGTANHHVLDTDPVKAGSGNHLSFSAQHDVSANVMNATVARDYMVVKDDGVDAKGIDWTREHTIQFTMRIDEDLTGFDPAFTDANDKYVAFQSPGAQDGTNTTCLWQAAAYALTADPAMDGKWLFSNGNHDGTFTDVNTGIVLVTDGIYDFTIILDPVTQTYDAILTDGTTTWDSRLVGYADGLGWRTSATTFGGYLSFGGRGGGTNDIRAFSLDDLVISQPPDVAIPGDASGDGDVDAEDAGIVAQHWGASAPEIGWGQGDFNGDHTVNAADASILAANWGFGASEGAAAPEPSVMLLLTGFTVAALVRRRR